MTDTMTRKRLSLSIDTGGRAHLTVPFEQLGEVTTLLDANGIRYWVEEEVLSINDGPEVAFVTFYRETDSAKVQRLLDSVP